MLSVINYHYVRKSFDAKYNSIFGITPQQLDFQIKELKKTGEFIDPHDLNDNILTSPKRYLLLTFDDGLKEHYDFALPVLEKNDVKAIFFVSTNGLTEKKVYDVHKIHLIRSNILDRELLNYISLECSINICSNEIEKSKEFYRFDNEDAAKLKYILNVILDQNERKLIINNFFNQIFDEGQKYQELYMNDSQIVKLGKSGMLGSHCHNHLPLGNLSIKLMEDELKKSREILESLSDSKIEFVSYPYGSGKAVNELVYEVAKSVGYKYGFTTYPGNNLVKGRNLSLNRFDCNDAPTGKLYNEKIWN
jgi:peptidoglycan/xylan/chitin deacetylase (PgdA/CDA1 family)